jgi:hypothetical protein
MWRQPVVTILMLIIAVILTQPMRAQQKPFTQEQVSNMVRDGFGDESGAKLVEQRGIDFAPAEDFLQSLKAAGSGSVCCGGPGTCPAVQGAPESIEAKTAGHRPGLSTLAVPCPWTQPKNKYCAGTHRGVYSLGLLGAKTEIRALG